MSGKVLFLELLSCSEAPRGVSSEGRALCFPMLCTNCSLRLEDMGDPQGYLEMKVEEGLVTASKFQHLRIESRGIL